MAVLIQAVIVLILLYVIGRIVYRGRSDAEYSFVAVMLHFLIMLATTAIVLPVVAMGMMSLATIIELIRDPSIFVDIETSPFGQTFGKFEGGSFLLGLLIMILLTAIVHYCWRQMVMQVLPLLRLSGDDYEISEYFIQWMTIYLAVYQFFFDGMRSIVVLIDGELTAEETFDIILNPANVNLVIQPLLISTWIVIVMEKLRARHHEKHEQSANASFDRAPIQGSGEKSASVEQPE
ncbi:SA1002 family membrane protein [Schaalia canis]|uniref:Uncharacterized protein n=1 Tax=Schaalia canis TaxID=100469 RepID=A0A3P1SD71_9ACTO|nr:hypothetical protein [Schaalia canis]RRC94964.1 hypothetical protein EII11_07720 [Schaalia canis]